MNRSWSVRFILFCLCLCVQRLNAQQGGHPQHKPVYEKLRWQKSFPAGFEMADRAPKHPDFFQDKKYVFHKNGSVSLFFKEMGRPDSFTSQVFVTEDRATPAQPDAPLLASFKYVYKDGTHLYMTTGDMKIIDLAFIYKRGKVKLWYK